MHTLNNCNVMNLHVSANTMQSLSTSTSTSTKYYISADYHAITWRTLTLI